MYIKAHPPGRELTIKAIGIVREEIATDAGELGRGLPVRWVWSGNEVLNEAADERYNVRANTLYEELSPAIQVRVLDLLLSVLAAH